MGKRNTAVQSISYQTITEFVSPAAGLKCRSQVTGHRSGHRLQVRLQTIGHRPQIRSQVTKNNRTLEKTVLD